MGAEHCASADLTPLSNCRAPAIWRDSGALTPELARMNGNSGG